MILDHIFLVKKKMLMLIFPLEINVFCLYRNRRKRPRGWSLRNSQEICAQGVSQLFILERQLIAFLFHENVISFNIIKLFPKILQFIERL